jgi:hypothetical protein
MRAVVILLLLAGIPAKLHSETPAVAPLLPGNFRHIVRSAGVIFSGTVLTVNRVAPGSANRTGLTTITFRVENAIRGVRQGQTLQVLEWSGLWSAGEHYRTGEHVLLFLYPTSRLGLTSPVGGAQGRFAIDQFNRVLPNHADNRHLKPIAVRALATEIRHLSRE